MIDSHVIIWPREARVGQNHRKLSADTLQAKNAIHQRQVAMHCVQSGSNRLLAKEWMQENIQHTILLHSFSCQSSLRWQQRIGEGNGYPSQAFTNGILQRREAMHRVRSGSNRLMAKEWMQENIQHTILLHPFSCHSSLCWQRRSGEGNC
jgi:hypothetical protein